MDKKARAQHAERLVNDSVLQEAFNVVLEYHTSVFLNASATDDEVLKARDLAKALNEVKSQLKSFVATGKMIEKRVQDREND